MKKKLIILSAVAALSINAFASTDMETQIKDLKTQIKKLEKQVKKNKKKIKRVNKKATIAKGYAFGDNIKWGVDFRSTADRLSYKLADNTKSNNNALLANRLLLNMKYQGDKNVAFYGTLAYNKLYGATTGNSNGYESFDWVTNETPSTDDNLKVKEAYWLYANDTFMGKDISWTASVGRRPSTGGLGINYREGNKRKSAIASTVNVEFDGVSLRWNLGNVTPLTGSWFKICAGRGITNATQRFNDNSGADYSKNSGFTADSNMIGFIFVPYDDGQYSINTNWATANHLIGYTQSDLTDGNNSNNKFADVGNIILTTIMFKADGIGDGISDTLDDTTFFASYSTSKTDPTTTDGGMLGDNDNKSGHSIWLGVQMPCPITEDGRVGFEYNHGSKYWRSMTYAEDTMIGSKIAARGTALEAYWLKPLTPSLSLSLRYTHISYDYTGSNAFFGADGTPTDMDTINSSNAAMYGNPVKTATDTRIALRYQF